ncbi:hypothetical protein BHE74_00057276 [Ensete ventricosum]|nr:hypothetical protein BHE74_00057276 [Ensete ventricosum]RZS04266.1 hypothetical protein BHM03_00034576 [Ensete ventricosum]
MQAATLRVISSRLAHRCMPLAVGVAALGGPQRRHPIASWPRAATSSSHGGGLIIQRYDRSGLREPGKSETRPRALLREHRGVEVDGQKRRGSDDEFGGAQLLKSKALVRKEVDSEECHSAKVDLPIVKKWT